MSNPIPRPEYPRPQFQRREWLCLNGEWQFEIDPGDSGFERGLVHSELKDTIIVPFCPESPLSGVENIDFLNAVWYRRKVRIPPEWKGQQVLLHFQAVDYEATVWVNGKEIARHRGGFTPISCSLKGIAQPGENITIVVRARDDHRLPKPRGKQVREYANHGCEYTRTTGIWQTVWMEPVGAAYFQRPRITPDVTRRVFHLETPLNAVLPGGSVVVVLSDELGEIARDAVPLGIDKTPMLGLAAPEERLKLWQPGKPFLYDLLFQLISAEGKGAR
jgi:beta-galactosidase/beta-glucuronidase